MNRSETRDPQTGNPKPGRNEHGDARRPGPPNQRHQQKAETRRRLLEAATEVFLEAPPTTASLKEIAARAGVRRQTLLYHFGNREGLMTAVLLHHLETFRAAIHGLRGGLRSRLEMYLQAHRLPLVRMVLHIDALLPDTPGSPKVGIWYPVVAADLEQQLLEVEMGPDDARKRAAVLARALLHMASWVAADSATEDEVADFVDTICEMALPSA